MVAVWDPAEEGDVVRYAAGARAAVDGILARGRVAVVAGGTGLYLRAALAELDPPPEAPPGLRERLAAGAGPALHARLRALDPAAAARVHPNDTRRVVRGLELAALGHSLAPSGEDELWTGSMRHPTLLVALQVPRTELRRRIAARTRAMLDGGVVEEVAALLAARRPPSATFARAHGLDDVRALLEGRIDRATCERLLTERTRQYAKRQETWLRRLPGVRLVDATAAPAEVAARIAALAAGSPLPSSA
jgi:tRNA dimethylallyltransferase